MEDLRPSRRIVANASEAPAEESGTSPTAPPTTPYEPEGEVIQRMEDELADVIAKRADRPMERRIRLESARRCRTLTARAGREFDDCTDLPIIYWGTDVQAARVHDAQAIQRVPAWMALHRSNAHDRQWINSVLEDDGTRACPNPRPAGADCDEYPFSSSAQGGASATPQPDLDLIDSSENRRQGALLNTRMYVRCGRQRPTDPGYNGPQDALFLSIPLPAEAPATTYSVCGPPSTPGLLEDPMPDSDG